MDILHQIASTLVEALIDFKIIAGVSVPALVGVLGLLIQYLKKNGLDKKYIRPLNYVSAPILYSVMLLTTTGDIAHVIVYGVIGGLVAAFSAEQLYLTVKEDTLDRVETLGVDDYNVIDEGARKS